VRRSTKAAFGCLVGGALIVAGTQAAGGALSQILKMHADSGDFLTSTAQPLDAAKAKITITEGSGSTTFAIRVTGIDPAIAGKTLGSHLHIGPCVEPDAGPPPGKSAGPHYNHYVALHVVDELGNPVVRIDDKTEVWFALVPDEEGMAYDSTTVPFVPIDADPAMVPGVMSVVVHEMFTNPDTGGAGARLACFPVEVPQWASAPE
jgi:Cu/Zn superoxide dismutase